MPSETYLQIGETLKWLLTIAWLLPLGGFLIEVFGAKWSGRKSRAAAYLAVLCIATGFVCSFIALCTWIDAEDLTFSDVWQNPLAIAAEHDDHAAGEHVTAGHGEHAHGDAAHADHGHGDAVHGEVAHAEHGAADHGHGNQPLSHTFTGTFYTLAKFGNIKVSLDYYIDGLTVLMFTMVTFIATCIHIFAIGYMSDELTEDYEDHFVHLPGGKHFHRPGRFYRFFSFLSLFCFAMLGLVLAGNIFQVFIFWELVGVCSYLLIGFYVERKSASSAANKAFIMNRVGDFGFLIGLMILWTWFGTFSFANTNPDQFGEVGLFQMVRTDDGQLDTEGAGMNRVAYMQSLHGERLEGTDGAPRAIPYWLLIVAGLGIFGGCIGKSAQFPLQTWLPDAMEGPTPVSALVHSATMVAAGVYLTGRFYPMFTPEVLLVIAYIGCITAFIGATIALVVTDIKKVLAYSTISQLGYMMLALGVGGWLAGLFHLVTHAFFKSLMFLCSGSVIHGCHHEQDMQKMGGLAPKMPITCWTMWIGVVAISGLAIPGLMLPYIGAVAFSGYHSKDAIVATALTFASKNPTHSLLFFIPLVTAGITAFYMHRMWFMTFFGKPRDQHVHDHAHESPWVMTGPLVALSIFAAICAWGGEHGPLAQLMLTSEPTHVAGGIAPSGEIGLALPSHHEIHGNHSKAGVMALLAAFIGTIVAYVFYCRQTVDPALVKDRFLSIHRFLVDKWQFDEVYDVMFVRPVHVIGKWCVGLDKFGLDAILHGLARLAIGVATWDRKFDEAVVDRVVNVFGEVTYSTGRSLTAIQTGRLRQYVMFIAAGVVCLFVVLFIFLPR
ncbi:MAG: NADH-quinone oxidoreductase subunit L [Planctomycetaceae bacterium]|nr:NADH-quinone oxidoreductase subunit L [Planctomycetaceae bacterium]